MSYNTDILRSFTSTASAEHLYLPNLTLWYGWHRKQGTLPDLWAEKSLPEICQELGVPIWMITPAYQLDTGGVEVVTAEQDGERVITYRSDSGQLVERWKLGPDGDWWQTEFAVKNPPDLEILLEIMKARSYVYDPTRYEQAQGEIGGGGVVDLELPRRPFSQIFLEWLGWSEGLMLLFDAGELVDEILFILEAKVQALVEQVSAGPGKIIVSPDNLDSQFISPPFFSQYLADSYRQTAETLHQHGKHLLVDTGGPIRGLLKFLADTGADGIQGVSGPPQCDVSLAEARELVGPDFTLWGGIPQDALLADFPHDGFAQVVRQAAREAQGDGRTLLGVADRVPIDVDLERLSLIPDLIK